MKKFYYFCMWEGRALVCRWSFSPSSFLSAFVGPTGVVVSG